MNKKAISMNTFSACNRRNNHPKIAQPENILKIWHRMVWHRMVGID